MQAARSILVDGFKITTLSDGQQIQYIQVKDPIQSQWISSAGRHLKTGRAEYAQGFTPDEAIKQIKRLTRLGYKGLSITNGIPVV